MRKILRLGSFSTAKMNAQPLSSTTSKGNQPKWYLGDTGIYIKQDFHGYESLAEWTVAKVLQMCTDIDLNLITPYYLCNIDGKPGCYSYDFKQEDEDEVTLMNMFSELRISPTKYLEVNLI